MLITIIHILLIILIISQIVVLVHLFYMNYKRNKEDREFWAKIHKELDESIKESIDKLNEATEFTIEGDNKNEQDK